MFKYRASLICFLILGNVAFGQSFVLDDFASPNGGQHASVPGESRAGFPPGFSGGAIFDLAPNGQVALDRGLYGANNSLVVSNGALQLAVGGITEIDWNFDGFNFNDRTVVWRGVSNLSNQNATLLIEPFQSFSGTDSVFGRGGITFTLGAGETDDFEFGNLFGASNFTGFRVINQSGGTFNGSVQSIVVVPEPNCTALLVLLVLPVTFRRRKT